MQESAPAKSNEDGRLHCRLNIPNFPEHLRAELANIASHKEVSLSGLVVTLLRKGVNDYSQHERKTYVKTFPKLTRRYVLFLIRQYGYDGPITEEMIEERRQRVLEERRKIIERNDKTGRKLD